MPNAEDIFAKLGQDNYFRKIDLSKGYWQIPMATKDKPKTGFVTHSGSYVFMRMPFGIMNSAAVFNRMMRNMLYNKDNVDSLIDDVLIHTKTWDEYVSTIRRVFGKI